MVHPAQATYDAKTLASQEAFLSVYPSLGTVTKAADAIGVVPDAVWRWIREDAHGFRDRYHQAQLRWAEYLEDLARKRVENPTNNGRTGSDVLLIAMLNANHPTKWRRDTVVVGTDVAKEMLGELFKLAQRSKATVIEVSATPVQQAEAQVARMLTSGEGKTPSQE